MSQTTRETQTISHQLMGKIFSGQIRPGAKLVERQLASELGVSRVPVREALMRMVAQGVLVGGEKGQGVRMRDYSTREVRQLYQFREMIEGGIARAAAGVRTQDDLLLLETLCDQMEAAADQPLSPHWAELDHHFHDALAAASHQERFIQAMKTLLAESHYVFFCRPSQQQRSREESAALRTRVLRDHRTLIEQIRQSDADAAEYTAREHMRQSADRAARLLIVGSVPEASANAEGRA